MYIFQSKFTLNNSSQMEYLPGFRMKLSELESSVVKIEISIRANSYTKGNSGKYEFHIAKEIRKKYEFDDVLFSISGNVILADFYAVRRFTQKINSKRKASDFI